MQIGTKNFQEKVTKDIRTNHNATQTNSWRTKIAYLKFSRVSNWVISLNSSSLKDAKTLRSLTRISTAFARSCLITRIKTTDYQIPYTWTNAKKKLNTQISKSNNAYTPIHQSLQGYNQPTWLDIIPFNSKYNIQCSPIDFSSAWAFKFKQNGLHPHHNSWKRVLAQSRQLEHHICLLQLEVHKWKTYCHGIKTHLSRASKYFCFLISKKIFIEYRLSSTFVNPHKYRSTSSHSPAWTWSSKCFILKKNPDSCSNLKIQKS